MGIGKLDLDLIIQLKRDGHIPNGCSVIELGAQQLANVGLRATDELRSLGQLFNITSDPPLPPPSPPIIGEGGREDLSPEAPRARDLWLWLGLNYAAIDIDGSPDSIPLDLNYDDVPASLTKKHQLVTNFGTTEHVANQLNAFKVIHDLTSVGGIMLHQAPSQGLMNHGLVNYNVKFFWMLARSNGYKWIYASYRSSGRQYALPQNIVEHVLPYQPRVVENCSDWRFTDASLLVALQKTLDTPYVAPLDVETGSKPANPVMAKRYWSVYEQNAFAPSQPETRRHPSLYRRGARLIGAFLANKRG